MKTFITIFIIAIVFISCRDKKNANNVATESTDTEVAIATLKSFYSSTYNGSVENREVLSNQYISKQLLEKIDELSSDLTLDYDPFIKGQDYFADILNSTLKITSLENKNEYRCCFLLFGEENEKETCVDYLLEKDKNGHFVICNILNDDILAGKRNIIPLSDDSDLGEIIFSKKVDMNKDGIEDSIVVYYQEEELFSTIKIVLSDKGKEKIFFNNKIINNTITSGEGFRNISFENRFFTIEENPSTNPIQIKYTTFSIDNKTNEIFLYKVEVSNIFNNAADDFDIIRTQKDFGKISFEDYAS